MNNSISFPSPNASLKEWDDWADIIRHKSFMRLISRDLPLEAEYMKVSRLEKLALAEARTWKLVAKRLGICKDVSNIITDLLDPFIDESDDMPTYESPWEWV